MSNALKRVLNAVFVRVGTFWAGLIVATSHISPDTWEKLELAATALGLVLLDVLAEVIGGGQAGE